MSWLSSATGVHIGGKHHPLIDIKRLGTSLGEGAAALTGQSWAIPAIEGASQKGLGTASPGPLGYAAEGAGTLFGPGGITDHLPNGIGGIFSGAGTDGQGTHGLIGDLAGKIPGLGSLTGGNSGLPGGNLIPLGLAASDIASAAEASRKADKFASEGWDIAKGNWDANDPLRSAGRERLLNPGQPNLGGLDAIRGAIPGGLPAGATSLTGASSALGGSAGASPPPVASPGFVQPPQGLSGQGPVQATQPDPNVKGLGLKSGFSPQVRY